MIDRRHFVTGLAALAAAGVVPALPSSPDAQEFTPRFMALAAPWYFSLLPDGTLWIVHNGTIGFTNVPLPNGKPVFHCFLDGDAPSTTPIFRALERAATFVATVAYFTRIERQHSGAIYFDYTQRDPLRPFDHVYTEDAPPRPELERIYALRGLDWYNT
jgi:hypothetical protein